MAKTSVINLPTLKCDRCPYGIVKRSRRSVWGKSFFKTEPCDKCGYKHGLFVARNLKEIDNMKQFTIYFNPSDYPDKYVTRGYTITADGKVLPDDIPLTVADTLVEARGVLPTSGHVNIGRSAGDDPVIVEVWV